MTKTGTKASDGISRRGLAAGAAGLLALARGGGVLAAVPRNPIVATPKLNQLGFLPKAAKRFVLTVAPGDAAPRDFRVETLAGAGVFQGQLDGAVHDLTRTAGEHVRTGDFSGLVRPGRYRVRIGDLASHPFQIGDGVYTPLVRDAARAFHLIRANVALDDPVTGLRHAAGHLDEAALMVDGVERDLAGGWYNAGDYGKWTHMAAISASQMMWLYTLRPVEARALKLDVPASRPALPDLLQQARWGLEWLLRMQNFDGSVLHKVDSEGQYAWGLPPEQDPHPRAAHGPSSLDAGVFTGVMLQAARVFARPDKAFAARCRAAALRAWTWLEAHPAVLHDDPNYTDPDPRQEILWATCEMAAATGDPALAARAAAGIKALGVLPFFWPAPQAPGVMALALGGKGEAAAVARAAIVASARETAASVADDPYGFTARPEIYTWGSVELALNTAVVCLFAAELGEAGGRGTAQRLLDYVLGCNALDHGFVTGHGENATRRPYHWTCRVWGIVMPGWASGGPNAGLDGADPRLKAVIEAGTPPAKCFVDACEPDGSWASNEGQTSENAALLLAAGLLGFRR